MLNAGSGATNSGLGRTCVVGLRVMGVFNQVMGMGVHRVCAHNPRAEKWVYY